MRKIFFSLFAFLCITSLCFAQEAQAPISQVQVTQSKVSQTAQAPVENKTLTGKVDLVTIGDTTKGIKSELVVVADDGQKLSFVVKSGTPVIDKDTKTITLSDIKKDNRVIVEYTTKASGTNKAQSIKLVE